MPDKPGRDVKLPIGYEGQVVKGVTVAEVHVYQLRTDLLTEVCRILSDVCIVDCGVGVISRGRVEVE